MDKHRSPSKKRETGEINAENVLLVDPMYPEYYRARHVVSRAHHSRSSRRSLAETGAHSHVGLEVPEWAAGLRVQNMLPGAGAEPPVFEQLRPD